MNWRGPGRGASANPGPSTPAAQAASAQRHHPRMLHRSSPTRRDTGRRETGALRSPRMKVLPWIFGIIFVIGLLVVLGIGGLIF